MRFICSILNKFASSSGMVRDRPYMALVYSHALYYPGSDIYFMEKPQNPKAQDIAALFLGNLCFVDLLNRDDCRLLVWLGCFPNSNFTAIHGRCPPQVVLGPRVYAG